MSLARTRIAVRLIAVAALAALTAGCFQPMYAERNDGKPGLREKLMGVEVPPVDKPNASREARIQVEIRNALAFKLYGNATGMPPTHRLVLRFTTSRSSLMLDPATALPSSENYGIDAQYNLIDLATNKSVMTGTTFSRVSYDIPGQLQRFARAARLPRRRGSRRQRNRGKHPDPAGVVLLRRHLTSVIPGRAKHEPGISRSNLQIPGPREDACPGMTPEGSVVVALRGKDIDAFLARPDAGRPIILLYGPDAGLVRERADALIASAVDDPNDPFSLVRLDGDELSAEPSRLVDEAMTIPMFGGRRAIRVRAGSRSFASGVDTLADSPIKDCRIVIEAGELRPELPLRKACERAKTAVAIACYPDTERDLARLIDEELRTSNLRIAPDARAVLMSLLGGDRQASRNELRKLALYAHGKGEIALDDVMTVVSDASELKLDPIVDGAFAGKPDLVESEFAKAMVAGTYPGVIISAAQRQAAWLHKSALAVAEGTPVSTLLESGYPRLHFSRKGAVEIALRNFNAARLVAIIDQLGTAALDMRKQASLASAIGMRTLLSIAANAKRRG